MIAVRAVIERLLNNVWYENSPLSWLSVSYTHLTLPTTYGV